MFYYILIVTLDYLYNICYVQIKKRFYWTRIQQKIKEKYFQEFMMYKQ